ncbi:MAG: hypothetical protein RMN53_12450 [Anaerolineae bacterium]|nr:hypothetical protein [Anaerolineae bacterium]
MHAASPSSRLASLQRWSLVILVLASFALRLVQLGADSLWYDETVSVYLAGQSAPALIGHTARDIHPPLYYLLLRGWLLLAGYPTGQADPTGHRLEFMAAFFSVAFGVLLVPLGWQLAQRLRLPQPAPTLSALLLALSPFGVWYSQEVRMYTVGAALGLVCLLSTAALLAPRTSARRLPRAALVYALAAAAGMYTLYYFAFLLLSLNALVLGWAVLRRRRWGDGGRRLAAWLAAQTAAALLYLPWLPVAWRQATDPPVPPWRTPPQLWEALVESWGALSFGQSADPARFWPLLAITLLLALVAMAAGRRLERPEAVPLLLVAAFGPLALILVASLATPLYHVRYLFTYSPAFSVLLALGLADLWNRGPAPRGLALAAFGLIALGSGLSLAAFWTDPAFVADDHRSAVRELAQRWRPGDVVLVNAGYAYPAVLTYWPLPVAWRGRLPEFTAEAAAQARAQRGAALVLTGHVDGDPDLGWGDPRSDFYALPKPALDAGMETLAAQASRLWHYRVYDTVNDPAGVIRAALADDWALVDDRVYPGEANLRVQGWQSHRLASAGPEAVPAATFDGWLTLSLPADGLPGRVEAGAALDVAGAVWSRPANRPGRPVAVSLRLADATGEVWAAHDEPLGGNRLDLTATTALAQPLRLTVPLGTAPGPYTLALVVYDPVTGRPLRPDGEDQGNGGQVSLGSVEVTRPAAAPILRAKADFGPLRLVAASTPATAISPGDVVPVELLWQAGPDYVAEPLVVVVQLLDGEGRVRANLEAEPLNGRHPTAAWQPGELVRDRHRLPTPADIPRGRYALIVGLYRAADGQRLTVARGPWGLGRRDYAAIAQVEVR